MPTYDYVCDACNHAFEEFQSITAKHLRKCPECGKLKLRRLIGAGAGILFKGSGFYETDYRTESYKKGEKSDTQSEGGDKGTEKKSGGDPKDATKSDTSGGKDGASKPKDES